MLSFRASNLVAIEKIITDKMMMIIVLMMMYLMMVPLTVAMMVLVTMVTVTVVVVTVMDDGGEYCDIGGSSYGGDGADSDALFCFLFRP